MAVGIGDGDAPAECVISVDGRSVMPPAPVHVRAWRQADGAPVLRWVRRSRAGWHWVDRVDAPLVEEAERYALAQVGAGEIATVTQPEIGGAALDGVDLSTLEVRQVGTLGRSRPAGIGSKEET